MSDTRQVFIGTDCGATMSKVGGVWAQNELTREQVSGVGLAIPGPYLRYGVLGHSANMPAAFEGWDFYTDYAQALANHLSRRPRDALPPPERRSTIGSCPTRATRTN